MAVPYLEDTAVVLYSLPLATAVVLYAYLEDTARVLYSLPDLTWRLRASETYLEPRAPWCLGLPLATAVVLYAYTASSEHPISALYPGTTQQLHLLGS